MKKVHKYCGEIKGNLHECTLSEAIRSLGDLAAKHGGGAVIEFTCDGDVSVMLFTYRDETDEERSVRVEREQRMKVRSRGNRHERYLELKEEFEPE